MSHIEPFIRWAGRKTWLVPFMKELTRDLKYKNYYEPFLGGAAAFFSLPPPKHAYLSDINAELIDKQQRRAIKSNFTVAKTEYQTLGEVYQQFVE